MSHNFFIERRAGGCTVLVRTVVHASKFLTMHSGFFRSCV